MLKSLSLCTFLLSSLLGGAEMQFYVAPHGSDAAEGSVEKPFVTLERARDAVARARQQDSRQAVSVYLREGTYELKQAFILTAKDGGSPEGRVTYQAYPHEKVRLQGGRRLSLTWEEYKKGIYQAQVPEGLDFSTLYVNDKAQVRARYPNADETIKPFGGYAADCLSPERVRQWENPQGGFFHVLTRSMWGGFHYEILGKKNEGEVILGGGKQNNRPENGMHDSYRFVENIFEELDAPKEWYLDREANILYYYPEDQLDLDAAKVEYASLETLIELRGTEKKPVQYVRIKGLKLARTCPSFLKNAEPLLRSDWTIYRGAAVLFEGTEHCELIDCELTELGGNAVFFNNYNRESGVSGCHIHEVGANGICFVGDSSAVRNGKFVPYGPRVSLDEMDKTVGPLHGNYPQHCYASDNLIHDIGRLEKQVAGVQISVSAFIDIIHNSIYEVPRAGINIGEGAFGGHLLEGNDVFDTVLETSDHGAFNSWGRDRYWGADIKTTDRFIKEAGHKIILLDILAPTRIHHNRFSCAHGWDIDLDDGSSYYIISDNLCLQGGIKLREGYYRSVYNNICLNNALHPHVWQADSGDRVCGNIFGAKHQPISMDHWGSKIDENWFMYESDLKASQQWGIEAGSKAGTPLFIDPAKGDFRVQIGSPLLRVGWKNFPMDDFGVRLPAMKLIARQAPIPHVQQPSSESERSYAVLGGEVKKLSTDGEVSATGMDGKRGLLVIRAPQEGVFAKIFILKRNDVILKINGQEVGDVDELKNAALHGQGIRELTLWRNQAECVMRFEGDEV